jgi:hypothetical protein
VFRYEIRFTQEFSVFESIIKIKIIFIEKSLKSFYDLKMKISIIFNLFIGVIKVIKVINRDKLFAFS